MADRKSHRVNMRTGTNDMRLAVVALLATALIVPVTVSAKPLTEEQGDAILEELRQIRQVLEKMQQQQAAPPAQARAAVQSTRAKASTSDRPVLGADDAPVTLVEFTDYQCPFCSRFFTRTLPGFKEEYIDTGKVRLVVKDLPLELWEGYLLATEVPGASDCKRWQDQEVSAYEPTDRRPNPGRGCAATHGPEWRAFGPYECFRCPEEHPYRGGKCRKIERRCVDP